MNKGNQRRADPPEFREYWERAGKGKVLSQELFFVLPAQKPFARVLGILGESGQGKVLSQGLFFVLPAQKPFARVPGILVERGQRKGFIAKAFHRTPRRKLRTLCSLRTLRSSPADPQLVRLSFRLSRKCGKCGKCGIKTKKMAARPGFEPRQTEPESVVLPLHHRAVRIYCKKWLRQLDSNQRPSG